MQSLILLRISQLCISMNCYMNFFQLLTMNNKFHSVFGLITALVLFSCTRSANPGGVTPKDSSLVNLQHLEHLYTPVSFASGTPAAGVYIYSDAPDYHLVPASGEGFTCVDDVARAALVYLRSPKL